jgi:hypothetical protein
VPEVLARCRIIRRALRSLCLVLANPRSRIGFLGSLAAQQSVRGITRSNVISARAGRRQCGFDDVRGAHRCAARGFVLAGAAHHEPTVRSRRIFAHACQRRTTDGARSRMLMAPRTRDGAPWGVFARGLPRARRRMGASSAAQARATRARCARWWCRRGPLTRT